MNNVFCLKNLQESSIQPDYNNILVYNDVERSFCNECFSYLIEMNKVYNEATEVYYRCIIESDDNLDYINESFGDFLSKIKEIIKKFIDFIKSLFSRLVININKIVLSDKYIKKHKEDIKAFDNRDEFEIDGFNFTIEAGIPLINAQASFTQEFVGLNFDLKDGKKLADVISTAYNKINLEIENGKYDKYRAEVIGQDGYIAQEDFPTELFECFRDGTSVISKLEIKGAQITSSMSRFENYEKVIKDNKKIKDQLEKDYKEIEKKINHLVTSVKNKDIKNVLTVNVDSDYNSPGDKKIQVTNDEMTKIDNFLKAKMNEVIELSNIHSLAFSYKLDAIKDCYIQDKKILYKALSNVQKNHKGEL